MKEWVFVLDPDVAVLNSETLYFSFSFRVSAGVGMVFEGYTSGILKERASRLE